MHPNKGIILLLAGIMLFSSFFTGCTSIFGTSFTLNSWSVCDDDGFPSLLVGFNCGGTVVLKTMDPTGSVVYSETFFHGTYNVKINIEHFRNSITTGQYSLKAYDTSNNLVSHESFSFNGVELSIDSCEQKWWKRDAWKGGYTLIGLILTVTNNGDVPAYPYEIDAIMDSNTVTGYVLPCVVLPGETSTIKSFIYREDSPSGNNLLIDLKDSEGEIIGTNNFNVELEDNVEVRDFRFSYLGRSLKLKLPYPDFLYEYYSSLDRIILEDYSFYVFDKYDDHYIDLLSRQLQYTTSSQTDADKINFAASFIQSLDYREDVGDSDYPNYPVETLFNRDGGCDCEDMSILTASVLDRMGFDVALFRLTNHMAVGVKVDGGVSGYSTYDSGYYFLETTSKNHVVGNVPSQYVSKPGLVVYEISSRPVLVHNWYDNNITIFYHTERGDCVKAVCIVNNLGRTAAENVIVEGVFTTANSLEFNEYTTIPSIEPGNKEKVSLMIDIPDNLKTSFMTRVFYKNLVVDTVESSSTFP